MIWMRGMSCRSGTAAEAKVLYMGWWQMHVRHVQGTYRVCTMAAGSGGL